MRRPHLAVLVMGIIIFGFVAYWGYKTLTKPPPPEKLVPFRDWPPYGFSEAVRKVTSKALRVKIGEAYSNKTKVLDRNVPEFHEILHYLKIASPVRVVQKITVTDHKTVHITIPYIYGIIFLFQLEDGTEVWFNSQDTTILWYESQEAIYKVAVDPNLHTLLTQVLTPKGILERIFDPFNQILFFYLLTILTPKTLHSIRK